MSEIPSQPPILQAKDLKHSFGEGEARSTVLQEISLELKAGETCSIIGPSGCGKSTLLYLLGLLDKPDSGEIKINQRLVSEASEMERTAIRNELLGFVFQFHFLIRELTALENVSLPLRKAGDSKKDATLRAEKLLVDLDLVDKRHRLANKLSGGEQQRVAIARALATSPAIVLADEPTGNLDARNSNKVFDLLVQSAREEGSSIILVTHNPDLAERADRCLPMLDGRFEE
ncbi:MAG: ABC transporter ATP-binding protein [Opitutae bacterium]|nr:ABC transporter ATP-binding protein [Opitutae bacterium]